MIKGKMSDGERLNAIAIALVGGLEKAQQMWDDCVVRLPEDFQGQHGAR